MGRLQDKVSVITGGASGMGRAAVDRFLAEGAKVVVADMNEANGAAVLADAAAAGHGDAVRFVRTDVSQEADVAAMVDLAVAEFGRLDVLFNNAGIGGVVGPITDTEVGDWNETLGVLLTGVFLGIKHGARAMQATGGGSIVNTASVAGVVGGISSVGYTTAKHGVIGLTRSTAIELARDHIRVNAICPGAINTPLVNMGFEEATGEYMDRIQPWPRHGRGADIASTAVFLASDDSEFITGESIVVDGALLHRPLWSSKDPGPSGGQVGMTRGSTGVADTLR